MKLTPAMEGAVLHWGEMGERWGVNRTVAQIHALLYLVARPMDAEEIARTLSVARSNVSNSLRELQNWGLVSANHVIGGRRDYYECVDDVTVMFQLIMDERKRRELDPTIEALQACIALSRTDGRKEVGTTRQLNKLHKFLIQLSDCYEFFRVVPPDQLLKLVKMGSRTAQSVVPGRLVAASR